jgi:GntR family transcriptional regulator
MVGLSQNGIPLYVQLEEIFSERIASGEWKVGETIPNELSLCAEFGVSRGPIRHALEHLVREGKLYRKQGKGTIVLPSKIESHVSSFFSFTMLIERHGMQPSTQMLTFCKVRAEANITKHLLVEPQAETFKIRRLRLANNEPLIFETVFVPANVCAELTEHEVMGAPLYKLLQEHYGVTLARSKQFFEPTVADEFEAQILGIAVNAPVLLIENITYTNTDRPVVFSKAIMRGDRVRYYLELNAPTDNS